MTSPSTNAQRVAEMHATMAAEPPIEVMGAFAREQAELAANGLPTGIAPAGTVLPDADLLDMHGAATTLYAAAGDGTSVLVFYRGTWLTSVNADGTVTVPMPATVILGASRTAGGSTSTPTTARAPSPGRSSTPSTTSGSDQMAGDSSGCPGGERT